MSSIQNISNMQVEYQKTTIKKEVTQKENPSDQKIKDDVIYEHSEEPATKEATYTVDMEKALIATKKYCQTLSSVAV